MYIIPEPKKMAEKSGTFSMNCQTRIVIASAVPNCQCDNIMDYMKLLKQEIFQSTGLNVPMLCAVPQDGDIVLFSGHSETENYTLSISPARIELHSDGGCGTLYAIQTLRQIIRQFGMVLPCLEIYDEPTYSVRAFYHDMTRGRVQTLDNLKKLADRMSFYKLNQLQLYIEHTYLFKDLSELWRDNTPLTAEEIIELDVYCKKLHIDLVPSLSSFGHLYHLLRTKSYQHLCELDHPRDHAFSFVDRMAHHTINTADPESMSLIKSMIQEYLSLFSSPYFNICGDETFDLGTGKTKELASSIGVHELYIQHIEKLCSFVKSLGKTPMFWGDIISKNPELLDRLPEDTICLIWGYSPTQGDESIRAVSQTKVSQYVCPGVHSWNHILTQFQDGYENIIRMCSYGRKYHAAGILNTDWGDYGHICHPEFSIPGMIYGAEFSWNDAEISFEDMNRRISKVEYLDSKEQFISILDQISKKEAFPWFSIIQYKELGNEDHIMKLDPAIGDGLDTLMETLKMAALSLDTKTRPVVSLALLFAEGIQLWNEVLVWMQSHLHEPNPALASRLEYWMYHYKDSWRSNSKEAELCRIEEVIFWYADQLRTMKEV